MDRMGENADDMWDEEDGFFYDVLHFLGGRYEKFAVRSLVGLVPVTSW